MATGVEARQAAARFHRIVQTGLGQYVIRDWREKAKVGVLGTLSLHGYKARFNAPHSPGQHPRLSVVMCRGDKIMFRSASALDCEEQQWCGRQVCGSLPVGGCGWVGATLVLRSTRAVLENPIFFVLRTALKDHQPPTANRHQPPTANRQPPTATNRCSILFLWFGVLPMS